MNIRTAVRADKVELARLAREEAYSTPLSEFHPGAGARVNGMNITCRRSSDHHPLPAEPK